MRSGRHRPQKRARSAPFRKLPLTVEPSRAASRGAASSAPQALVYSLPSPQPAVCAVQTVGTEVLCVCGVLLGREGGEIGIAAGGSASLPGGVGIAAGTAVR